MTAGEPRRLSKIPSLDGLRGLAVSLVIGFHLTLGGHPILRSGSLGVNLFFVLSGFLITALLIGGIARTGLRYGAFLTRRALRLVPALLVMVVVTTVVLQVTSDRNAAVSLDALPFVLTWTSNLALVTVQPNLGVFSHTWSLALEEQFYILWPLLLAAMIRRCTRRTCYAVTAGLAVACVLVRVGAVISGRNGLSIQADSLLIGCLAGMLFCWSGPQLIARLPTGFGLGVGWVVAAAAILAIPHQSQAMPTLGYPLFAVLVAVTLLRLSLAETHGWPEAVLRSRTARRLGVISYGIYLWHVPAFVVLADHGVGELGLIVVGPVLAVALAEVSYRVVETPFLRIKDRGR